jgi:hypothetical protein
LLQRVNERRWSARSRRRKSTLCALALMISITIERDIHFQIVVTGRFLGVQDALAAVDVHFHVQLEVDVRLRRLRLALLIF